MLLVFGLHLGSDLGDGPFNCLLLRVSVPERNRGRGRHRGLRWGTLMAMMMASTLPRVIHNLLKLAGEVFGCMVTLLEHLTHSLQCVKLLFAHLFLVVLVDSFCRLFHKLCLVWDLVRKLLSLC